MKRRRLLQTMAAAPAFAAVPKQAAGQSPTPQPAPVSLTVESVTADVAAQPVAIFFTADQFHALTRLCDLLVPTTNGQPGATDAGAAVFLDFLLSQSPSPRQELYRSGLNHLNESASKRYGKPFTEVSNDEADALLKPLHDAWTYNGPVDPFARFLVEAKEDVLRATMNSRPFITTMSKRVRGYGGSGYYWFPVE